MGFLCISQLYFFTFFNVHFLFYIAASLKQRGRNNNNEHVAYLKEKASIVQHHFITLRPSLSLSSLRRCDHSCLDCLGPGENNCSSCVVGYNLEAGSCVVSTICKDGELGFSRACKRSVRCLAHPVRARWSSLSGQQGALVEWNTNK